MTDPRHVQRFNDAYGHEGVDLLLAAFGQLLTELARGDDIGCHIGKRGGFPKDGTTSATVMAAAYAGQAFQALLPPVWGRYIPPPPLERQGISVTKRKFI